MIELDNQLRSWTPRRPSARVERRLFGGRLAEAGPESRGTPRLAFLVPATALMLIVCGWLNQHYSTAMAPLDDSGPLVAMILSNQSAAAYLPGSFDRQQNHLGNTFELTNDRSSPSSMPSFSAPKQVNW